MTPQAQDQGGFMGSKVTTPWMLLAETISGPMCMLQSLISGGKICSTSNICNTNQATTVERHTLLSMLLPRQQCLWVKLLGRCRHHCLGALHRTSQPSLYCSHLLTGWPGLQTVCNMLWRLVYRDREVQDNVMMTSSRMLGVGRAN